MWGRCRCCKLELYGGDPSSWADVESGVVECIKRTLELRVQHYRGEVARLSENRYLPDWNFTTFFFDKARHLPSPHQHKCLQCLS